MERQPLVSVITPCYNGEKFLSIFLDSLLDQTYKNIEFIFVDDGSTDRTRTIFYSYVKKFKGKGYKLVYVKQATNKGQAAALNKGLKYFTGEYLTWPDADDILHKDNIRLRVEFLEQHKECGMVVCESPILGKTMNVLKIRRRIEPKDDSTLFHDLLTEVNVSFAGGAYLFRSSSFLQVNPHKEIYVSRGGQNWQMILPMAYSQKCGYIHLRLYLIRSHPGSHSRRVHGLQGKLKRMDEHEKILLNTLDAIPTMKKKPKIYYTKLIKKKYALRRRRAGYKPIPKTGGE